MDGVRLPGTPILDDDTYHRLVALYAARRRGRQPSGRYVLTGLAACGLCGAGLAGRPVSGTDRRHYWCKACHRISVDVRRLDEWAADWAIDVSCPTPRRLAPSRVKNANGQNGARSLNAKWPVARKRLR